MIKRFSTLLLTASVLITSIIGVSSSFAITNTISLAQVTKDITYLASDELKGRDNFSPEIRLAANYIATRFQESGLVGLNSISGNDFLQKYQVTKTTPQQLNLTINGQDIPNKNLAMASTITRFSWSINNKIKDTEFALHNIGKDDDMRTIVGTLNKQGGETSNFVKP